MKYFIKNILFLLILAFYSAARAVPYAIHTFERPKRDHLGQLMVNQKGQPVVDHLYTISDRHKPILRTDEQEAARIAQHIVQQSSKGIRSKVYVEDLAGEFRKHTVDPLYSPTLHKNISTLRALWFAVRDLLFGKKTTNQLFLHRLHYQCAEQNIPVENIEFRSIQDAPTNCNHHPKRSFKALVENFENYEKETTKLKQNYDFKDAVASEYTLKDLKKKLSKKMDDCYCSLFTDKKKPREIILLGDSPDDKSLGACITKTGFQLLENRALVEVCKHSLSKGPCDRYLATGGLHSDEIQGYPEKAGHLHKHGWRLVQQSGTSVDNVISNLNKLSFVHSTKHFQQLPRRGSSIGFYEKLAGMCKKQIIGGIPIQAAVARTAQPIPPIDHDKGAAERRIDISLIPGQVVN